mgnify:CR=1 FL=1
MVRPRFASALRELQHQEPTVHIEDCDVRRERTSPPDDCGQTSVTWRKTQSSITKYVPDTERGPHPRHLPASRGRPLLERADQQPDTPRTHHRARGLHPQGQSSAPRVRPRVTPAPRHSCTRSQSARIGNCDVRRGRTSPPDDCVQTPVTWRRTQSSITKYVPDTERSPR